MHFHSKIETFQKCASINFRRNTQLLEKIWILQRVSALYAKAWYSRNLLAVNIKKKRALPMLQTERAKICWSAWSSIKNIYSKFSSLSNGLFAKHIFKFTGNIWFFLHYLRCVEWLWNIFLNKFETFEITMTKSQLGTGRAPFLARLPFHFALFIFNFTSRKRLPRCFISHFRNYSFFSLSIWKTEFLFLFLILKNWKTKLSFSSLISRFVWKISLLNFLILWDHDFLAWNA